MVGLHQSGPHREGVWNFLYQPWFVLVNALLLGQGAEKMISCLKSTERLILTSINFCFSASCYYLAVLAMNVEMELWAIVPTHFCVGFSPITIKPWSGYLVPVLKAHLKMAGAWFNAHLPKILTHN